MVLKPKRVRKPDTIIGCRSDGNNTPDRSTTQAALTTAPPTAAMTGTFTRGPSLPLAISLIQLLPTHILILLLRLLLSLMLWLLL